MNDVEKSLISPSGFEASGVFGGRGKASEAKLKIQKSQIYDIVKDMKGLTPNECPKEVTYEMLVKEMDGGDLQALISATPFDKKEMTNKLWRSFYIVFFHKKS